MRRSAEWNINLTTKMNSMSSENNNKNNLSIQKMITLKFWLVIMQMKLLMKFFTIIFTGIK